MLQKPRISVATFIGLYLVLVVTGATFLAASGDALWSTVWVLAALSVTLLGAYFALRRFVSRVAPGRSVSARPSYRLNTGAVMALVVFAGGMAAYHLFKAGIPLFASNIETQRFDFTSSGLLGIPGRMYLYGVPIAWLIASANAEALGVRWRNYWPWRVAIVFLVGIALLSGFKSGLLAVAVTVCVGYTTISGRHLRVWDVIRKYWLVALLPAAVYAVVVATLYPTYMANGSNLVGQLLMRVTTGTAQPAVAAIQHEYAGHVSNGLLNDLNYYIHKYSGAQVPHSYSFERAVSAGMIHADPGSDAWTTPVTIGGLAELTFSLGVVGALFVSAAVGGALAAAQGRRARSVAASIAAAVFTYGTYAWVSKGGLVYYALNLIAVVAFLALIYLAAVAVSRLRKLLRPSKGRHLLPKQDVRPRTPRRESIRLFSSGRTDSSSVRTGAR